MPSPLKFEVSRVDCMYQNLVADPYVFNPFMPDTGTLVNSENPDEMPQNVAFHQGLHCLLRENGSSETILGNYNL